MSHAKKDGHEALAAKAKAAELEIVDQSRRIEFYLTEYSVELLAKKMHDGDFVVPNYQRDDTWEPQRKARFIESLLMGLPIPFLFFWEDPATGKLEIVDGAQRLRTIEQFILKEAPVNGDLSALPSLQGLRFIDLPPSRQRKIKNRSIRGIVLNEHADDDVRYDLFDRINTSSKIANASEVRRGALTGPFMKLVIDLAEDATFKSLAPMAATGVRLRQREELVTRFFAYGDGLENYHDEVSAFLFAYTKRKNQEFTEHPKRVAAYRRRFKETMQFVGRAFPYGFRKKKEGNATPRARFESIAVGSYLALAERPSLADKPPDVLPWLNGREFKAVTGSDSANVIKKLKARIDFVREKLLGA